MGLEVGWYLRFAKSDTVIALVSRQGADSVRHAMHMHNDWTLVTEDKEDHILAHITRNKPLFDKDES